MHILIVSILTLLLQTANQQTPEVIQLNSNQFLELTVNKQVTLIDVRTLGEFKNGHIKNANQLNYYAFNFKNKLLLLPKNEAIFLYCNTGYRSERAAQYLVKNGYSKVYNLEFGIMEWEAQNKPVLVDNNAKPDVIDKYSIKQFESLVLTKPNLLIDFYAPWCAPCQQMFPVIDSLKTHYQDEVTIVKINVDASKNLIKKLNIIGVPRLHLYTNGELQHIHKGAANKQQIKSIIQTAIKTY